MPVIVVEGLVVQALSIPIYLHTTEDTVLVDVQAPVMQDLIVERIGVEFTVIIIYGEIDLLVLAAGSAIGTVRIQIDPKAGCVI